MKKNTAVSHVAPAQVSELIDNSTPGVTRLEFPAAPKAVENRMATAIDNANCGKLVQYDGPHGTTAGTLIDVRAENVTVQPLGPAGKQKQNVIVPLAGVRLIGAAAKQPQTKAVAAKKPAAEHKPKAAKVKPVVRAAAPKAAKVQAEKSGKPDSELPTKPGAVEVELTAVPDSKAYTARIHGHKAVVCYTERNRSAAAMRFNSLNLSKSRVADCKKLAAKESLPLFYAAQVRVLEKFDGGWLVSAETFNKVKGGFPAFLLSAAARELYAADKATIDGVKFTFAAEVK